MVVINIISQSTMMNWINYCPRTWEEIKDQIFIRKVEGRNE